MKITDLIQTKVKKKHEFAGPCPFCGGNDRFITWPDSGKTGAYWCRGCKRSGDGLGLIRELQGLTFLEAVSAWGLTPEDFPRTGRPKVKRVWTPKVINGPSEEWSKMAEIFLEESEFGLVKNQKVRDYLHGRGLTPETIQAARLGWNPRDEFHTRTLWGLPPATDDQGNPTRTYLKSGLIIPHFKDAKVIGLKIRLAHPEPGKKYTHVAGSDASPMAWGLDKGTLIIVESELDGWLLHQEAADLAGVIAMGSASNRPDEETHRTLRAEGVVLVALDSDAAGAKESWGFWKRHYPNAKRWPIPGGFKDPTEAKQGGLDIRAWIKAGLPEPSTVEPEQTQATEHPPNEATATHESHHGTQTEKTYKDQGDTRRTVFEPFPAAWKERFDEATLEHLAHLTVDAGLSDLQALTEVLSQC